MIVQQIKNVIEEQLKNNKRRFIIFPFGEIGMQVKNILKDAYDIDAEYILDNHLCQYNPNIKPLSFLENVDCEEYVLILACINFQIYDVLKENVRVFFKEKNIAELMCMKEDKAPKIFTQVGEYSYGPLCNHQLVESVGKFCSFAEGCDVVINHPINYISTHPFIYHDDKCNEIYTKGYDEYQNEAWYLEGVRPRGEIQKCNKIKIGNDVWLGKNVIITNGANIGNGVIAGAGTIITKDVPDYAVVVGVQARIIRYRYTLEQIEALNDIQWWNWTDEQLRERYDDLYLPIEEFISKYK